MKLMLKKGGNHTGGGFTIIETLIVLTITALTILIAMTQLQGRSNDVRFRDSALQLESVINQQKSQINQGADLSAVDNVSGRTCGDECIFAGKVIEFKKGTSEYTIHTMLGSLFKGGELSGSLLEMAPQSNATSDRNLDWQLEYIGADVAINGSPAPNSHNSIYVGFFRLPSSTELFPIVFSDTNSNNINLASSYATNANPARSSAGSVFGSELCFQGINGEKAKLTLGDGNRNDVVSVDFDIPDTECNF